MIVTTAAYDAAALRCPSEPVYRFQVVGYAKVFVYRPTGRVNELAWIQSIGDWGVSVDPQNGSYTIDDLTINVMDIQAAITHDLGLLLLEGRRCILQSGFDGLALSDYCTLFSGIVKSVTSNGDGAYSFTCNDYQRLTQRLVFTKGNSGTTVTTETTYNASSPYTTITRVDTTDLTTGLVATTASAAYSSTGPGGPAGTIKTTSGGVTTTQVTTSRVIDNVANGQFTVYERVTTTVARGVTTTVTQTYGATALYTNVIVTTTTNQATGTVLTGLEVTYTENGVPGSTMVSDVSEISSSNPRLVNGHPLDIMLSILQDEIGYADSDLNLDQIEAYRDTVFTGVEFYFVVTGSVDAKDFIENQLLKPLGGYLYPSNTGQLCVAFAQPLNGALVASAAITPRNLQSLPTIGASPLVNVLSMRFDKNDAGTSVNSTISSTGFLAQADIFYTPSIADLTDLSGQVAQEAVTGASAVQGQLIIESDGMRSGFQGFLLSKMIANSLFAKYGFYNPVMDCPCHWAQGSAAGAGIFKLGIADFVTVTHPLLPDRRLGVMGLTNQLFQVTRRSYSFDTMQVNLTLEDASGVQAFGALKIAPTGEAAYTAVSDADRATYLFMSDTTGKQSNGDVAGTLG